MQMKAHIFLLLGCLFSAISMAWCQACLSNPEPSLPAIKQSYDKGNYGDSIKLCRQALSASPEDPQLHYYLANSLLSMGSTQEAKAEYAQALSLSKDGQLTAFCSRALASLGGNSSAQDKRTTGPVSKKPQSNGNDLPTVPEPDWRNISGEDRAHVTLEGEGSTAARAYKDVLWCLSHLNHTVKDALWAEHVQIIICTNLGDYAKTKGWQTPPGISDYGVLHGVTGQHEVYITQTAGLGKPYVVKRPGWVCFHELGHAFDYRVGHHPNHADMQGLYDQDRAEHKPGTKFHNQSVIELLPDLFAGITSQAGGLPDESLDNKFALQKKGYPRCWEFMRELLSGYGVIVPK
jgi:tetratricopeptide (TPR) repeat protein